jgi:hypothetical protein
MSKEELCNKCVEGICDVHSPSQMTAAQKEYARLLVKKNRRAKQKNGRNGKGNGKADKLVKLRRPPAHLC